jgi:uncharacterized protein
MPATIVNVIAIIIGSLTGLIIHKHIKEEIKTVIFDGIGIFTLIIGLQMAFETQRILALSIALILGGIAGTLINIDRLIFRFGVFLKDKFAKKQEGNDFATGFLDASILFCVGAMAIIGSFKAGTENDYTLLYTKSVLDGFVSIIFASALGIGVAFSAISVLIYQGALTLLSIFIKNSVSPLILSELTAAGGAMIMMIGINLLNLKKIKTANFLPAFVFIVVFVILDPFFNQISEFILSQLHY